MTKSSLPEPGNEQTDVLTSSLERESETLWKTRPKTALFTLLLPCVTAVVAALAALVWGGAVLVRRLTLAIVASAAAGRFIIWTGAHKDAAIGFSPIQLAMMVFVLDIVWAVVLTWHAGILFRVPWVGKHLKAMVREGAQLLQRNSWMKRITLAAVFGFVMLPVSSTGSIGGSLLGRLLGLSRLSTFVTVLVGSVAGGTVMLLFAQSLAPWFEKHGPEVQYGVIGILILLGIFVTQRYRASLDGSQSPQKNNCTRSLSPASVKWNSNSRT